MRLHKFNESKNYQHFKISTTIVNRKIKKTVVKVATGTKKYLTKRDIMFSH